jgi:hypothetical protein
MDITYLSKEEQDWIARMQSGKWKNVDFVLRVIFDPSSFSFQLEWAPSLRFPAWKLSYASVCDFDHDTWI